MKVYFVEDTRKNYVFATSVDDIEKADRGINIECTATEREILDKAERLFFDLQKFIEERVEKK